MTRPAVPTVTQLTTSYAVCTLLKMGDASARSGIAETGRPAGIVDQRSKIKQRRRTVCDAKRIVVKVDFACIAKASSSAVNGRSLPKYCGILEQGDGGGGGGPGDRPWLT